MNLKNVLLNCVMVSIVTFSTFSAADNKVVVIPLGGDESTEAEAKIAFISNEHTTHNFGGLEGADEICANEANLNDDLEGRTFKAWLIDDDTSIYEEDDSSVEFRTLKLPEGDIISPSGEVFPERWTHYLKFGGHHTQLLPDCDADAFDPFSTCVEKFEASLPAPTVYGASAYQRESLQASLFFAKPQYIIQSPNNPSITCNDYTSDEAESENITDRIIIDGSFDNLNTGFGVSFTTCRSRTRLWCLEQ